jgi:hypothetical protein
VAPWPRQPRVQSVEQFSAVWSGSKQLSPGLNCSKLPSECLPESAENRNVTRFSSRVVHIGPVYAPGMCPLRDATFCDEWDSLDTDCDGALSR